MFPDGMALRKVLADRGISIGADIVVLILELRGVSISLQHIMSELFPHTSMVRLTEV